MRIFILTGKKELSNALCKLIKVILPDASLQFSFGSFNYESINPQEWKEAELLITEANAPENPSNPVGWRTAKKSMKKTLIFFTLPRKNFFPEEFFIATSVSQIKSRLKKVVKSSPPLQKDYENVEEEFPFLTFEPRHHH